MSGTIYRLARMGVVLAAVIWGAAACNNDDYKTSEETPGADSGTRRTSTAVGHNDSTIVAASPYAPPADSVTPARNPSPQRAIPAGRTTAPTLSQPNTLVRNGKIVRPPAKAKFAHGHASIAAPKIYSAAQVAPAFPGGQNGLNSYINNHVNYPRQAIDDDVSGVVHVSFVVDEHGKVTKAKVVQSSRIGDGLDEEALRVVNAMPAWTPGKIHGKNVRVRMELPIWFQLTS